MQISPIISVILVSLILSWNIFAVEVRFTPDSDTYLTSIFTTKEGLPQSSPTSIVQTKDGYLWISTFGGLARFDGVKFTVFTTSNTPELISNRITALYEDRNGILWIGSEEGEIMNYQNGVFAVVKKFEGDSNGGPIDSFFLDQNDALWIAHIKGLRTYNIKTGEVTIYEPDQILKKRVDSQTIFHTRDFHVDDFAPDSEGNLWMATKEGLLRYRDGEFTQYTTDDGLPDNHIYAAVANPSGGIMILTNRFAGIYQNNQFKELARNETNGEFSTLTLNNLGEFYFTSKKLLYRIKDEKITTHDITAIATDGIRPIFYDKQGILWFGTNNGLIQFRPRLIKVFAAVDNKTLLPVSAITESADKTVWSISGRYLIRWKNGEYKAFESPAKDIYFFSIAIDKDDKPILSGIKGIYKFENESFSKLPLPVNFSVSPVFFDRDGTLWLGERIGGLYEYKNGNLKKYTLKDGLANNWISYIMQDSKGAMWIGTKGGVSRLQNGKFTNYKMEDGLLNENVRDIYEDQDGTYWIGTYGGGIARLKDDKIVSITPQNGLSEGIVSRILEDANGNFWLMGNRSIYTVSRQLLNDFADGKIARVYCTTYDELDGMETGEGSGGNQSSGWKTSDGRLWFSMIRGGVIINPVKPEIFVPPVYIESVALNGQPFNPNEKLEIKPNQENLEIGYTALSFVKSSQTQFRYKLEGYDSTWQEVGTRRTAYYPFLPPGTYKFIVSANAGGDVWSEKEASFEIVVLTPFWRTWWFLGLVFLSIIGLIIFAYQRRLQAIQNRRLRQEEFSRQLINAHETERNRIAGDLHDGLGQDLLIIKNWALLLLKDIKEDKQKKHLEDITEMATHGIAEMRAISRNLRPQNLQRLGLTQTLVSMIEQIEESSQIKFETNIDDIDNLFSDEETLSVYRIVQENFNNIVKHSEAEKVEIKISKQLNKNKVLIKISDNGKGFDLQSKKKTSFGLDNIDQRVFLLGGTYSIKSEIGKGTEVIIQLPIKRNEHEKTN